MMMIPLCLDQFKREYSSTAALVSRTCLNEKLQMITTPLALPCNSHVVAGEGGFRGSTKQTEQAGEMAGSNHNTHAPPCQGAPCMKNQVGKYFRTPRRVSRRHSDTAHSHLLQLARCTIVHYCCTAVAWRKTP